ncbi:MAG: YfhO family protein [Flavobacterium sp.]
MLKIKIFYPHLLVLIGFIFVSLAYFYPVLQGKKIYQSDIVQYTGMAKEQNDFRAETGEEPYWTNAAFGGMPTYQLGAKYPHNYIKKLDSALRFLPRPADYLFLYFIGFYILLCVLKIDPLKAFFGALAFGFSTYLIIILGVGHNAKAHAIAYMPMVVAGVLLVFQRRYILGGLLTMVAAALEIQANHFQMTYYLLLLLIIIGVYYGVQRIKEEDVVALGKSLGVFAIAGILAIGANATNLLATSEYTDFSTRGKNELTIHPDGSPMTTKTGMSYEYITEYSYGKAESFNLIAPRLFGGGNSEKLGEKSNLYDFAISLGASPQEAKQFAAEGPTYWGDQPIVAAPAYVGAIVFFLMLLALFVEKRKIKYVFLTGAIVSLMLSWGKNFPGLTNFFIDYVPLYNKFRAVSSIQVVLELCLPVLAVLGLQSFLKSEDSQRLKSLKWTTITGLGILIFLWLFKGSFSFSGLNDGYYEQAYGEIGPGFVKALIEDRKAMYVSDLLRSGIFMILAAVVLFASFKKMISTTVTVVLVGTLMVADLVLINKNYVNNEHFVNAREMDMPFQATEADKEILEDDDLHFRVFEPQGGMSSARASFFHSSLGGYSAVKPQRIQQLYDYHLTKNNTEILNMFNVKYVLQRGEEGMMYAFNSEANGNAWFVNQVEGVLTADEFIQSLKEVDTKEKSIISISEFPVIAKEVLNVPFVTDSLSQITLVEYQPNYLKYQSQNTNEGVAVFSEVYYPKGWVATINGKEADIFRVNYVLRALKVPAGNQTIEFKFEPEVVKKGSSIALFSSIGMLLLLAGGMYVEVKKRSKKA